MKFYEIVIFHMVTLPVDFHGSVTTKFNLTVHVLIYGKMEGVIIALPVKIKTIKCPQDRKSCPI